MPLWRLSLGGAAGERVTSLALSPLGSPLGLVRGGAEGPEGEGPKSERPEGEGQSSQAAAPASQALAAASYSGALCLFQRLAASAGWGPWEAVALAAAEAQAGRRRRERQLRKVRQRLGPRGWSGTAWRAARRTRGAWGTAGATCRGSRWGADTLLTGPR